MKKLHFTLISNNEIQINIETNYYIKDNILFFKDKTSFYQYYLNDKRFIKKDPEKELKMEIEETNIIIKLLENNYEFDMPIEIKKFENTPNQIIIEYTFMSDEQITNCIIIEY